MHARESIRKDIFSFPETRTIRGRNRRLHANDLSRGMCQATTPRVQFLLRHDSHHRVGLHEHPTESRYGKRHRSRLGSRNHPVGGLT